jgi:DNA-binding PadR family transcriptional regulator
MTLPTQLVLRAMLEDPTQEMYGLQISQAAELPSGTIHPILARLEACGWLESRWEDIDPATEGRPRRRYYHLSNAGVEYARTALARVHTPRALVNRLRPNLAGGAP